MKRLYRLLVLSSVALGGTHLFPAVSSAAELIYMGSKFCPPCQIFEREIALNFAGTELGRSVELRRVSRFMRWPEDLSMVTPAYGTPTFILVSGGAEIGRFFGYRNPLIFRHNIEILLERVN